MCGCPWWQSQTRTVGAIGLIGHQDHRVIRERAPIVGAVRDADRGIEGEVVLVLRGRHANRTPIGPALCVRRAFGGNHLAALAA